MAFRVKQIEKILSDSGMPLENINKCAEDLCKRHAIDLDEIKEARALLRRKDELQYEAQQRAEKVISDAQAEANRLLEKSLTDGVLKQQYIEKWDGKLPVTVA